MHTGHFTTATLNYDKATKTLLGELSDLRLSGFPKRLVVTSHHTGNKATFMYDEEAAMRAEFWDGMEAHYRCMEPRANAEYLILIND